MKTIDALERIRPSTLRGIIDRRILVNFRCDPAAAARVLPKPFQPKLVNGFAMVGLCLIRLKNVGPAWWPEWAGLSSENAAHRIAVEWEEGRRRREGVFVLRRDTASHLNALAGGRVFPGVQHVADFKVSESLLRFKIAMQSRHDTTSLKLVARVEGGSLAGSVFGSLPEASNFFAAGSLGWSTSDGGRSFEGIELETLTWRVTPLLVERVEASVFEDPGMFPAGTVVFDNALLMRNVPHEWHVTPWRGETS